MNIALHISEDDFQNFGINFNLQVALTLANTHPEDHYILIFDHPIHLNELPINCTTVLTGPVIKNRLSYYYWYEFKLPSILKKYNAAVFIPHPECFSSKIKLKQLYIIQQHTNKKSVVKQRNKDIEKAAAILNVPKEFSPSSKFIDQTYNVPYGMPEIFEPLLFDAKEAIKKQYSFEHDYFFAIIPPGEKTFLKTMLKSFSHFKKWQKSSLKLIILTAPHSIDDFHLYKFREDVTLKYFQQTTIAERASLLAASYCNIVMNEIDLISSVKCASPSILVGKNENLFDDASLYAAADEKSLSKQMITVYKDEYLRNQLIQESASLAVNYTWNQAAAIVYKAITSIQ